ncbi:MAG TPA: hypothetical protein VE931_11445 [Pyrinomonadaceae bacterium]|nr:hypothetical protein [Pyrinomonadaceae bacterium]
MNHHTIAAILVLLLFSVTHAQDKPQSPDAARREKAIELLQSLATQVSNLQSPENRARIGANIADSLWAHDEKRARVLFISIEEDINWGLRPREVKNARDDYALMVFMQLRTDIVTRIAKRDGELAFEFLRATAPNNEKLPRSVVERERDFEVKLATQIVASNPDLALKIGRQSLSGGFSDNLLPLIRQLHNKHREHGITLYKETVRALRDADFPHHGGALDFARSLAQNLTPPLADEPSFRDFMELWISATLANRCDKSNVAEESTPFCDQARALMPQMKRFAPEQTARLKHFATNNNGEFIEFPDSAYEELREALDAGELDDALALAKQYPQLESLIYWEAAMRAQANGETERAQKIANGLTSNPEVQARLLAQLKADNESASITDEQLERIPVVLNKYERVEDQIQFLTELANRVGAKNRPAALKLLDRASGLVESLKPGQQQMRGQIGLALLYCTEKSDRGLSIMESLIPKLNELIDAAAKLDDFDTHYLREGEWNMSADGPLGEVLTDLSQNAAYYAWTDFDRAVSLAGQFERAEIRMMAQTKLAQSILAGPPKRFKIVTRV